MPERPAAFAGPHRLRHWASRVGLAVVALLPVIPQVLPTAFALDPQPVIRLVPDQVKQGGVSVLSLEWPTPIRGLRIQVGDRPIPALSPDGQTRSVALIGIDLEQAPGELVIRAEAIDPTGHPVRVRQTVQVLDARYPVQHLTVPRPFVELDAATLERVSREKAVLDRLWATLTPERLWRAPFRVPLEDAGPGFGFGLRRLINGVPRAPHTGTDFSASPGTLVLAANAGTVALVTDHFFAGTSVILDHGLGLFTMYFHLQESLVRPGQRVERGQPIARVGNTGRATGPHLHWGARLHGARIDPQALLQISSLD